MPSVIASNEFNDSWFSMFVIEEEVSILNLEEGD